MLTSIITSIWNSCYNLLDSHAMYIVSVYRALGQTWIQIKLYSFG